MSTSVNVGDKSPDFTLPDQDMNKVSLSDFTGKPVALIFFPLAFSPVCTAELSNFSAEIARLRECGARLVAISVDSPFTLKAFAEDHSFEFPLLSDFNKEVSKLYGIQHDDLMGLRGVAMRSVFILDSDGVVTYKWVSEDPLREPDYSEALSKLDELAKSRAPSLSAS